MSFKRDGDDKEQLQLLRQRRIRDLLGESIPDDEAKLLSNGKLACIVCHHNPIFDTMDTLLVHRHGKKHAIGAAKFADRQTNLRDLIQVRKVEHFEKYGNTNIKIAAEHLKNHHLISSTPYDARTKKSKPYDRKLKVHVSLKSSAIEMSRLQDLPGNSSARWSHLQSSEPILHDAQLKNIFRKKEQTNVEIKPYTSKRQISVKIGSCSNSCAINRQTPNIASRDVNFDNDDCKLAGDSNVITPYLHISTDIIKKLTSLPPPPPPPSKGETPLHNQSTDEEIQYAAKLRQLRGAGWKKDWDGKWIRDEDAEFDSDEETPDL